jgi:hypothetical protein
MPRQIRKIGKIRENTQYNRGRSTPSQAALALLDAMSRVVWGTSSGKATPQTKDNLEAAEELAQIGATEEDLRHVRDRLLCQKDGFWKARGVSLKNIANNFHLAALGPLPEREWGRTAATSSGQAASTGSGKPRKLLRRVGSASLVPVGEKGGQK